MADQHNIVEEEEKDLQNDTPRYKRKMMSKYTRPIDFVSESTPAAKEVERKRQKTSSSSGDQVASFYRSIITSSSSKSKTATSTNSSDEDAGSTKNSEEDTWWCKSCNQTVPKSDYTRHIQGTAHMVSNSSIAPDLLKLNGKNVGFKMMQSQGWKYEEGLGPEGEGRRHPIATVLKQDRLGVGHEETGRKAVTHKYKDIEKKVIVRQRLEAENQKDSGKEIARRAKAETERRAAILRYMKS